jgi:hypothetical protein
MEDKNTEDLHAMHAPNTEDSSLIMINGEKMHPSTVILMHLMVW